MVRSLLFRTLSTATLCTSALLVSCGPPPVDPNTPGACTGRIAGDLVISEFMANPAGEDSGKEYFELYNATSEAIELNGITLRYTRKDGSAEKKTKLTKGLIAPGSYYVVGDVRDDAALPGYLDDTYKDKLGSFNNSDGKLAVLCDTQVLDEVTYSTAMKDDTARTFDGATAPDAIANDDEAKWCNAPAQSNGFFGSPRAANASCGATSACSGLFAGDLVITEFLANPPGADEGGEYIELYNARESSTALAGVTLRFTRLDGSSAKTVALGAASIPAGDYFTLGDVRTETLPPHIDLSYGTGLGALSNTDGVISVHCGDTMLDEVKYPSPKEGSARTFDGTLTPNADDNDDDTKWCNAAEASGAFFGTPGAANGVCATVCTGLNPGDLIITEFMSNPDDQGDGTASDTGKEYIEVYNARGAAVDLTGVKLKYSKLDGTSAKEVLFTGGSIPSGKYWVFGDVRSETLPAHIDQSYGDALGSMLNSEGTLSFSCGDTELDSIQYTVATQGNRARVFDGNSTPDEIENDNEGAWCHAQAAFGPFFGSPGAINESCGTITNNCIDPDSQLERTPVPPTPGRLIVSEVMANPKASDDTGGEYIELHALDAMDLNGVVITKGSPTASTKTTITSSTGKCIPVNAGSYIVLTKKLLPDDNGGIAAPLQIHNIALTNTEGATLYLSHKGTVIDQATYPKPADGKSAELSGDRLDATVNDSQWAYCDGTAVYGDGDLGTPGLPNQICPAPVAPGECRDTTSGMPRLIDRPMVGELVITEVMASPTPTATTPPSDRPKEWFEAVALAPFDLNEVDFANEAGSKVSLIQKDCVTTVAGQYLLLAQSSNGTLNGGLPSPDLVFDFELLNASSTAVPEPKVVVRSQGTELDSYIWTATTLAASNQLSSSAALDPSANDGTANRCETPAANTYGTAMTDRGTPKAPNVACP